MSGEWLVLEDAICKLNVFGIDYLLTGSFAANFYTVPRMTRDIDFVVDFVSADIDNFVKLFGQYYYLEKETIVKEVDNLGVFNLVHKEHAIKVDFIMRKNTDFQSSMFSRRRRIQFDNIPLWIITIEDLVLIKMIWAMDSLSEVHLRDVSNLMKAGIFIDKNYINTWVEKLKIDRIF